MGNICQFLFFYRDVSLFVGKKLKEGVNDGLKENEIRVNDT